jgi:Uma2 family endonuclease
MSTAYISFEEQVRIPSDAFDLPGFRRWVHSDDYPERGKISFIDGEIVVDLSPEEISSHAQLKLSIHAQLWMFVRKHKLGKCYPDGVLLINEAANFSNEPDFMYCSVDSLKSGRVQTREFVEDSGRFVELAGSPDLVVELVSRTSVRKDTKLLRDRYYAAGIGEYWLIDARGEEIDFKLLKRGKSGYLETTPDADGFLRSTVLNALFQLTRTWNEILGFEYTLRELEH